MPGTNDSPVDDDRLATPTTEEVAAPPPHNAVLRLLEPGEELHQSAAIGDAVLAVTSHRIAIVVQDRTAMDIVIDGLRRIQLDIEKSLRPRSFWCRNRPNSSLNCWPSSPMSITRSRAPWS